jgi:hypothetical protein
VLLERAIAAAKLNKFDELLVVVSDRLQKLTNMLILAQNGIEKLASPMTYEHHIGGLWIGIMNLVGKTLASEQSFAER